jgi:nucleoside-diphosphate-sugar epimerase
MLDSQSVRVPNFQDIYQSSVVSLGPNSNNLPKSILITGAQGMLGHGLAVAIQELKSMGYLNETLLYLSSRSWSTASSMNWKGAFKCELITNDQIPFIREQVDLALHTASPSNITQISTFEEVEHANLGILRDILKIAPAKIVYISTGEVYRGGETHEEEVLGGFSRSNVRDWYPIVKIAAENELKQLQDDQELEVCVIRLFHTFGPGVKENDGRSFADVLWGATTKNEIVLKSKGEQVRTFLYLSDALDGALSLAFNHFPGFSITNLGSPTPTSIYEFAQMVGSISGATIRFDLVDTFQHSPNKTIIPNVESLILKGWSPKVELAEGIQRTISWIRNSTHVQR